jgi:hypothetical protein
MQNHRATVISQFANSPVLLALVDSMDSEIDPSANIDAFYDTVWNINTASGYGLDVWGRIVGVSRNLAGTIVGDAELRLLILFKAFANITATNIPTLNVLIRKLFALLGHSPTDRCYVTDLGGMTMAYRFEFVLTDYERSVVRAAGVLPHPAGVGVIVQEIYPGLFGFSEMSSTMQPFGQGTFLP